MAMPVPLALANNPSQKIKVRGTELLVTRESKETMEAAIDATSNQPMTFHKCKCAITAAAKILQLDPLQCSTPQTKEELDSINWNEIIPGKADAHPQGKKPDKDHFAKARVVHAAVKDEKDTKARENGHPHAGVQSHCILTQHWKQW